MPYEQFAITCCAFEIMIAVPRCRLYRQFTVSAKTATKPREIPAVPSTLASDRTRALESHESWHPQASILRGRGTASACPDQTSLRGLPPSCREDNACDTRRLLLIRLFQQRPRYWAPDRQLAQYMAVRDEKLKQPDKQKKSSRNSAACSSLHG